MNKNHKLTKKDIYAKYGIEYKDNKIFCAPLNMWISELIPVGTNTKVGAAGTWSIYHGNEVLNIKDFGKKTARIMAIAGITEIKASCPCHCDGCYCDNGCYNFDSTKAANMLKLILARLHMAWLENAICACIEANNILQCRIHAAGDFFSKAYAGMWGRIAEHFPNTVFWTYTKEAFALSTFEKITNVFIVPSVTPFGFNFGTCSELLYRYRKLTAMGYRVHICACGTDFEKHCADCKCGCKAVGIECDYVLFIKHSTKDYKAGEKDPSEFAQVCEIIASQNN